MSLNWKEINLVLSELGLPGSQIQKARQSAYDLLCLEIYGKVPGEERPRSRSILIALSPGACRLHETALQGGLRGAPAGGPEAAKPAKPAKPLRFAEFCRSRLVNGWIEEAAQLGTDRIVRILIRRGENRYQCWVRLWSNAANVIVTDETGLVLDAMRRSPRRGEVSGGRYAPDPPEGKAPEKPGSPDEDGGKYRIRELPGPGSFNRRIDAWYVEHGGSLSLEALREEARKSCGGRMDRLELSLEKLRLREADYAAGDRFREYGDIIMANLARIAPGDLWLEAENFYGSGVIRIELDPHKKPAAQARHYYERSRKAKSGLAELRREIEEEEAELTRLRDTLESLLRETNPLILHQRLKKRDGTGKAAPEKNRRPGLAFKRREWLILVGRDAAENDALLRRHAKGPDLWLHTRDYAGSYVFIRRRSGKSVPLDILLDAGNLALFYSKGRNNAEGDLFYTQVKFLRRAKNAPRGTVIPSQEKNLHVTLDPARLRELERCKI